MFRSLISSAFVAFASLAHAQSSGLPVEGEILPGWREADGRHMAGLSLDMAPGWKTYWRTPGAGGIPPRFNWSGSKNVAAIDVRYPVPKVMWQNGLQSIGYDQDVVFPLIVTAKNPNQTVELQAEVEIGVCEEVCIPMTLRLEGTLPPAGTYDRNIGDSLDNQPTVAGGFDCQINPISDGLALRASTGQARFEAEIVVIEVTTPGVWVSPSSTVQNGATVVADVEMVPPNAKPFALARSEVRMTMIGGGRALEMRGCR